MSYPSAHWPVDGHVHFHTAGAVAPTLDAAASNFTRVGGNPGRLLGGLLLSQTSGEQVFESLSRSPVAGAWRFEPAADESVSLIARRDGAAIVVVCGRQVRSVDGLEVLALGTRETFPDGMSFSETVLAVRASDALAVIPWGFGKWLGERGQRVAQTLESLGPEAVFLGDNGSRLAWLGLPAMVRESARKGFRVLPGTDPFPIAGGYRPTGGFGFLVDRAPPVAAPWRNLREWIVSRRESPVPYGRASGPLRFVVSQVAIQFHNRMSRGRPG